MTPNPPRQVDQSALKSGQAITIGALLVAFVVNSWHLVLFVAIAQCLGGVGFAFAPYRLIYRHLLRPSGLIRPRLIPDNPEPHRFAMLVGAAVNGLATLALLSGAAAIGWALVWLVIALANLNLWLNFCLGCWLYYQLNRLGVPGFHQRPLEE